MLIDESELVEYTEWEETEVAANLLGESESEFVGEDGHLIK